MNNLILNYDTRPYLPDIFMKDNIYNTFDSINKQNNISLNSTIFIFNINESISSQYNDPNYLLYGTKNPLAPAYIYPPLDFYYSYNLVPNSKPYIVSKSTNKLNNNIRTLLFRIGYNISNIDESQFIYEELIVSDLINKNLTTIIYIYFNLKSVNTSINYNSYSNTTFYDQKYWNIIIYPFINLSSPINSGFVKKIGYTSKVTLFDSKNVIDKIDFDTRETIKYYEKIDYKYFENISYTMNQNTNMETMRNYSYNIKNYVEFINEHNNKNVININLNEISKLFYYPSDYNQNNLETYTNLFLNNKHINKNKGFSSDNNKYSYTSDDKVANLKKLNINLKEYSNYKNLYYNNQTNYEEIINYYVNTYFNIMDFETGNNMIILNSYLLKIFLLINPRIIDENYLLNNVFTDIKPLFADSNSLEFGVKNEKVNLFIKNNIKSTNLYYVNKFKITFSFFSDSNNSISNTVDRQTCTYIIILEIIFFNSNNLNILEFNTFQNSQNISYTNYTFLEQSVSLSPTINNFNDYCKIYELLISQTIKDIKKYYYSINYSSMSKYPSQLNQINFYNFYSIIPNIQTQLKTSSGHYYNNVINVLLTKVNNFIKDTINIEQNFYNFIDNQNIKNYISFTSLYDENIILKECPITNNIYNIKYIEYYSYFPKIEQSPYQELIGNYVGKYSEVVLYPYDKLNISSFEQIPAGKYIKYNYINYLSVYPSIPDINFVKSVKTISEIINYNFSLLIMLPFNINEDDNFYSTNPKNYWESNYSMNIGGNYSVVYLVLTDLNGKPFDFYGKTTFDNCENTVSNGIVYGIKMYNYTNYYSENLKLNLVLNLYFNNYLNLNEFTILIETYINYTDSNNLIWDINNSYLKLHNFNSLKEIVYYDFKRFKNNYDITEISNEYAIFNYKNLQNLSDNKVELNSLRYTIKISIYLSNLYKIIYLLEKCYNYLTIIIVNVMLSDFENSYLINLIKYNSGIISDLLQINYDFNITSGTFNTSVYEYITSIYSINVNNSLENLNNYKKFIIYILNYSKNKIINIIDSINVIPISNIYWNIYKNIYSFIGKEKVNYWVANEVTNDIDNFISTTSPEIFNFSDKNFDFNKKKLLLSQIKACLNSIALNSTKIDELFNLAKLMGTNVINQLLPPNLDNQVLKNYYIYNTTGYTTESNVPKFDIIYFLEDMIKLINKLGSLPISTPEYKTYQKSIQEGIITYITNTIDYFKQIINTIVNVYIYMKNLPGPGINIYDPIQTALFYDILGLFYDNYNSFFNILYTNKINLFYEYDNLKISFDNLFYSCEEFLFYIRLKNDFINANTISYTNTFVNEDLYKIIKTDTFYDFLIKTINNIDNLVIKNNPELIILYLEKIKIDIDNKFSVQLKSVIDELLEKYINELNYQITTGIPPKYPIIEYCSYYVIPYQDLLLYKGTFNWASFNFNEEAIQFVIEVDEVNGTIFNNYYTNPQVSTFYKQALGYNYLTTPYKYININNTTLSS